MLERPIALTLRSSNFVEQALTGSALLPATIAAGMGAVSFALFSVEIERAFVAFVFCSAFGVYQLDRVLGVREDRFTHPIRAGWTLRFRAPLIVMSIGSIFAALVMGFPYVGRFGAPLVLCSLAGLLYSVPIGVDGPRIKDVWWLKPWLVAAAWTSVIVLFPALLIEASLSGVLLLAGYRFFYIAANVLMCEIAEAGSAAAAGGACENTRTFAVATGIRSARRSVAGCLILATALATAMLFISRVPWLVAVDMVGIMLVFVMARRRRVLPSPVAVDAAALWPATVPLILLVLLG